MRIKPPPNPILLILASFVFSATGGGAVCALSLSRCGMKRKAAITAAASAALLPVMAAALWFVRARWYYIALAFCAFNLAMGFLYFFAARKSWREWKNRNEGEGANRFRGGGRRVIFGIITGLYAGLAAGIFFGLFYGWLSDAALSTLLPINPDIIAADEFVFMMGAIFMALGGVIGGIAGGLVREDDIGAVVKLVAGLVVTGTILMFMWHLFVDVIVFHSYGVSERAELPFAAGLMFPFVFAMFSVIGAFILYAAHGAREFIYKTALVGYLCLMLALTTVVYSGIVSYDFLILGKIAEKRADIRPALLLYEKSLTLYPSHYSASYLQFRIGLLLHKIGYDADAESAFKNVLTKYTANEDFVKQAKVYIDRLESAGAGKKRIVIPGVETRTEYRSSYCAPNSLALVFNYWRKNKTAKQIGTEITYSLSGTEMIDMLFYAENNGFDYNIYPDSKISDIRSFVRRNVPVLVFIPHHVFVVFGFDEALDTLIAYDVATYDVWVDHPAEDFKKEWQKTGNVMAVMLPSEESRKYLSAAKRAEARRVTLGNLQAMLAERIDGPTPEKKKRIGDAIRLAPEQPEFYLDLFNSFEGVRPDFGRKHSIGKIEAESDRQIRKYAETANEEWGGIGTYLELEAYYGKYEKMRDTLEYLTGRIAESEDYRGYQKSGFQSEMRGGIDYILGDYDGAVSQFGQSKSGSYNLGLAYEKAGSPRAAYEAYLKTIFDGAAYDLSSARHTFDKIERLAGQPFARPEQIEKATMKYVKQNPYDPRAYDRLAAYIFGREDSNKDDRAAANFYLKKAKIFEAVHGSFLNLENAYEKSDEAPRIIQR
ncbi:MAG: hypothetical protein WCX65_02345 [bacterium]